MSGPPAPAGFVLISRGQPEQDLGPEYGIFDGQGLLAASYRRVLGGANAWVYARRDTTVERFLILKDEDLARLYCEAVAGERGRAPSEPPPDLDEMLKSLE